MIVLTAAAEAASSGPSWAQVIGGIGIGSIVSALITGGFLRSQSKRQDAREDRRLEAERRQRELDREAEKHQRERDRSETLADFWRARRHQAHIALLRHLTTTHDSIHNHWILPRSVEVEHFADEWQESLISALNEVALLAEERTARLAETAYLKTISAYNEGLVLNQTHGGRSLRESQTALSRIMREARDSLADYRASIRFELGIVNTPSD